MVNKKVYDLTVLGASGFTGRQVLRALRRQAAGRGLRLALAGRRPEALAQLADEWAPEWAGHSDGGLAVEAADATDPASLRTLTRQSRVLLNVAGPYAAQDDAVVAACVEGRCHHLDLSGEVFWMRRMRQRHHGAAQRRGVLLVSACGYEALPFDVATQAMGHLMHHTHGQRCLSVDIAVRFSGPGVRRLSDAVSGGTLASLRAVLDHGPGDTLQRMDCLLPDELPEGWNANAVALRNAAPLAPWWDEAEASVMAPTLPAPFINPPVVLHSAVQAPAHFAPGFRYREGLPVRDGVDRLLSPIARALPGQSWARVGLGGTSLAAQWSAAATLAAPLAVLSASADARSPVARQALRRLIAWVGPKPGDGPRPERLDGMAYTLTIRAEGERGQRLAATLSAQGHPGYRSTPEMLAAVAVAVAEERLAVGRSGWHTPGTAFGPESLPCLQAAGLEWRWHETV